MRHYIVVSDKYQCLLEGYFYFYEKYFRPYIVIEPVVLGFNRFNTPLPSYCLFKSLGEDDRNWGRSMLKFFSKIEDDYFLLSFEDHYIVSAINKRLWDRSLTYINEIEKISLTPSPNHKGAKLEEHLFLTKTGINAFPITTLMPSIWKQSLLVASLHESQKTPHDFEKYNNGISRNVKCILPDSVIYGNLDAARKGTFDVSNLTAYMNGIKKWKTHNQKLHNDDFFMMEKMHKVWKENIT